MIILDNEKVNSFSKYLFLLKKINLLNNKFFGVFLINS